MIVLERPPVEAILNFFDNCFTHALASFFVATDNICFDPFPCKNRERPLNCFNFDNELTYSSWNFPSANCFGMCCVCIVKNFRWFPFSTVPFCWKNLQFLQSIEPLSKRNSLKSSNWFPNKCTGSIYSRNRYFSKCWTDVTSSEFENKLFWF